MDKTLLCEIVLADGSRYLVSNASNVSIDSELMFGETELKVNACFDSWVDEKIPELAYKDNISMTEPLFIGKHPDPAIATILSDSTNELRNQLSEQLGINLVTDSAPTATSVYNYETCDSITCRNTFKPDYVYVDRFPTEYSYDVYKPEQECYGWNMIAEINKNEKEEENGIMKINNKALQQIIIDEDRRTITAITTDSQTDMAHMFGIEPKKYVTVAKASKDDDFDPYVGVAMTLAYQLFGSKENFRKFVREDKLVRNLKKEKEAKQAAKKAAKAKAEEDRKKAADRRAKKAKKDDEIATDVLKKISKFINKTNKKNKEI